MSEEKIPISEIEPKQKLEAVVKKVDLMGALLFVGGHPALLHISQVDGGSKKKQVENVSDVLTVGQELPVWVLEVDTEKESLLVSMFKPPAVDWNEITTGDVFQGTVVRLKKYGAFIDIGAERPGLVHVSEMSTDYVEHPKDVVSRGDQVEVQVIGLDREKNQIDLSMKALQAEEEPQVDYRYEEEDEDRSDEESLPTAMAVAMQRALNQSNEGKERSGKDKNSKKSRQELDDLLRQTLERHKS